MRKVVLLIISLFFIIISFGCDNNKKRVLTCIGSNKGNNMNAYAIVKYNFEGEKLLSVDTDVTFKDITVDNLSAVWNEFKEQFNEQNFPVEESGYKRTTKADDKNYTFTVSINIDFEKISKETREKYGVDDVSNSTYEEIKNKILEDNNFTCE